MDNNKKGIIVVAISLGVVGLAYYFLVARKKSFLSDSGETVYYNDNFNSAVTNTGLKPTKDGQLIVNFNYEDNKAKNFAKFYTNNRVIIFNNADKNVIARGTYSNGGKTIKLDSGKEITSGSVFGNLLETIK
jgi:hypothetical protein